MEHNNLEVRILKFSGNINLSKLNDKYGNPDVLDFEDINFYEYEIKNCYFLGMMINKSNYLDTDSSGNPYNIIVEARGKNKRKINTLIKEFEICTDLELNNSDESAKKRIMELIEISMFVRGCDLLDKLSRGITDVEYFNLIGCTK